LLARLAFRGLEVLSVKGEVALHFWLDQALAQASTVCSTAAPSPSSGRAAFPAGFAAADFACPAAGLTSADWAVAAFAIVAFAAGARTGSGEAAAEALEARGAGCSTSDRG